MHSQTGLFILLFILTTHLVFAVSPNIYIEQQSNDNIVVVYKNTKTVDFYADDTLPQAEQVRLAVPPSSEPTFSILEKHSRIVRDKNQGTPRPDFLSLVQLSEPFVFRNTQLVVLDIHPVLQHDKDFIVYDSLLIRIDFNPTAYTNNSTTMLSQSESHSLAQICLNANQAKNWQLEKPESLTKLQSNMQSADWYKIVIDSSGFYQIDKNLLERAGMSTTSLHAEKIQIYNRGRQVALNVNAPTGRVDSSFQAIFYAEALDNSFTAQNVYWLTFGYTEGVRMHRTDASQTNLESKTTFRRTLHLEQQKIYAEKSELTERWYWSKFDHTQTEKVISFSIPQVVTLTFNTHALRIQMAGVYADSLVSHQCEIILNDSLVWNAMWQGNDMHQASFNIDPHLLVAGENTIEIRKADLNPADQFYLDCIDLEFDNHLYVENGPLVFKTNQSGIQHFQIKGIAADSALLFNISTPQKPEMITFNPNHAGLSFQDTLSMNTTFMVLHENDLLTPELETQTGSQLLLPTNQAEYLIITPDQFKDSFVYFQKHKKSQGLQTRIITLSDIYNDFNDGIPSVQAIKDFLYFAFYNWQKPAPYYCLLVGDTTLDPRDYLGNNIAEFYMPTYITLAPDGLSQISDDFWFGCVTGTDPVPDYLIGRLPVHSTDELNAVLQKIIDYETQETQAWQKDILYIADKADEFDYEAEANYYANNYLSTRFTARKLFIDNYDITSSHQRVLDKLNQGALVTTFLGKGTKQNWSSDSLFYIGHVNELENESRLPLLFSFQTENGIFYDPITLTTLPEAMINRAAGGAIASLMPSTSMPILAEQNMLAFVQRSMLSNYENNLGTVSLLNLFNFLTNPDQSEFSHSFPLLGDPSLHIKMSGENIGSAARFSGTIRIDNSSVRSGKLLSAWVNGEKITQEFTIQSDGRFGIFSIYEDIPGTWQREGCVAGDTIQFRVANAVHDTVSLYPLVEWKPGQHQYVELFTYPTHVENAPDITFSIDGRIAGMDYFMGDPIANTATIECNIDFPTSSNDAIYLYRNEQKCPEHEYQLEHISSKSYKITYTVNELQDGEYNLDIYTSQGRVQNATLNFTLTSELALDDVMNYPNPMQQETHFTFVLQNDKNATATLKIYTLAGRMIQKIEQPVNVGFNQIFWDGRDHQAELPANGVYLYQLTVTDGVDKCSKTEKLIIAK